MRALVAVLLLLGSLAAGCAAYFFHNRYLDLPKKERPDYKLGFEVGKAEIATGFSIPSSNDAVVDRAHFSIAVGVLVRRWGECSRSMSFLSWIQFITMITKELEMGCIAGDYKAPFDISFRYRVFFHVPTVTGADQPITRIDMELCSTRGRSIFSEGDDAALDGTDRQRLEKQIARTKFEQASLSKLLKTHTSAPNLLFGGSVPRDGYLGP